MVARVRLSINDVPPEYLGRSSPASIKQLGANLSNWHNTLIPERQLPARSSTSFLLTINWNHDYILCEFSALHVRLVANAVTLVQVG